MTLQSLPHLRPQILPPRHHSSHWPPTPKATSRCDGATTAGRPAGPDPPPWWTIRATDTHSSWSGKSWSSRQPTAWPPRSRSWWTAYDMFCSQIRSTWRRLYAVLVTSNRCSLTQRGVPVSPNLPCSSRNQQIAPPRRSLAPPGGGPACCTCEAAGTSAPSPVLLHSSLWGTEGAAGEWGRGRALERVQGQGQGQGPAWITPNVLTV